MQFRVCQHDHLFLYQTGIILLFRLCQGQPFQPLLKQLLLLREKHLNHPHNPQHRNRKRPAQAICLRISPWTTGCVNV